MSLTDPLGDMLTRIRNGQKARKKFVTCQHSRLRENVLSVLKGEGFIADYTTENNMLKIVLRYVEQGLPVIKELARVSKPGRRVYSGSKSIPKIYNGLGVSIVSTPKGVMADHAARDANVGGEVLCRVF
jgi:small subunit ribosomal protein S8